MNASNNDYWVHVLGLQTPHVLHGDHGHRFTVVTQLALWLDNGGQSFRRELWRCCARGQATQAVAKVRQPLKLSPGPTTS